jgi:hypothetical protein
MRRFAILVLIGLVLAACSKSQQMPTGRWVGHYESPSVMVVAWLEVLPSGQVRVSAPDLLDIGEPSDEQRIAMRTRLASDLSESWSEVNLRHYDFDGRVFRKPGGFAPQMEWDPVTRKLKLVFYFGMQRSIRIQMQPVKDFNEDTWLNG